MFGISISCCTARSLCVFQRNRCGKQRGEKEVEGGREEKKRGRERRSVHIYIYFLIVLHVVLIQVICDVNNEMY